MIKTKAKYIGLDVGGSKIVLQTFDKNLKALKTLKVKTFTRSKKGFLDQLFSLLDDHHTHKTKGIGVAVPGIVHQKNGVLVNAPHLPTGKNLALRSMLEKRYRVPIHIDNDINAFLWNECEQPKLRRKKNILAIMLGTGLGGAAMINEELMYGASGYAGEFGHIRIGAKQWEELTSGYYLAKNKSLEKDLLKNFGLGLSNLNLIFNPEAIVLGGSVYLERLSKYKMELEKIIKKHSLDGSCPILVDASKYSSVPKGVVQLLTH